MLKNNNKLSTVVALIALTTGFGLAGCSSMIQDSQGLSVNDSVSISSPTTHAITSTREVFSHKNLDSPHSTSMDGAHSESNLKNHFSIATFNDSEDSYWISFRNQNAENTTKEAEQNYSAPALWGDLVARFQFYDEHLHRPSVKKHIKQLLLKPNFFYIATSSADLYLHFVYNEIKKRGMPMELALLPIVESLYSPRATSAKGAAGLWQFTRKTGHYYGLTRSWWYDARFDIYKSTISALNLLQDIYFRYNDWPLALAAYNYGIGNVNNAIKRAKKKDLPTDFWSLKLPKETQQYVPKLLAYSYLIANQKKYQIQIKPIENKKILTLVNLDKSMELSTLAKASEISLYKFKKLNPGFRRHVPKPNTRYTLFIPSDKKSTFDKKIKKLIKTHVVDWGTHRVKSGDTLYGLARFYGVSLKALISTNRIKKSNLIRPGDKLIIPQITLRKN